MNKHGNLLIALQSIMYSETKDLSFGLAIESKRDNYLSIMALANRGKRNDGCTVKKF